METTTVVKSVHKTEKAAVARSRKIAGSFIIHEPGGRGCNELWLVAVKQ